MPSHTAPRFTEHHPKSTVPLHSAPRFTEQDKKHPPSTVTNTLYLILSYAALIFWPPGPRMINRHQLHIQLYHDHPTSLIHHCYKCPQNTRQQLSSRSANHDCVLMGCDSQNSILEFMCVSLMHLFQLFHQI